MKRSAIIPFLVVIVSFLFLANFVVYESFSLAFNLTDTWRLVLLSSILGGLSLSFIVSIILGNYYYNWFTRIYSTLSAVWMGFFAYFFLSSVVYSIFALFFGFNAYKVGEILFGLSFLVGIYGVLHADKIIIKKVKISLTKLPQEWIGKKAVWISDLHLGQILGPAFAEKITNIINSLSPDIIFIGGDLFDGTHAPDSVVLSAPLQKLSATHGVYYVTGNHEEFGDESQFISAVKQHGFKVLSDEIVIINGLQIIGVDYRNSSKKDNFRKILSNLKINLQIPSILLKHEPKDLDVSESAGITLQISGHTHKAQIWPLSYIAQFIYKGFSYDLNKLDSMRVYTSSGVGSWGPPLRVGTNSEIVLIEFDAL